MIDRLASVSTGIHHDAITLFQSRIPRQFRCGGQQMPKKGGVGAFRVGVRRDMDLRDEEKMNRGLRIRVGERKDLIILIKPFCRDVAPHNPAKDAIRWHIPGVYPRTGLQ